MSRYALIVGVSEYVAGLNPLPSATQDVHSVHKVLRDYGEFLDTNIISLTKPNTEELRQKLGDLFATKRKSDELVLFYYSGHGLINSQGTKAYLCSRLTEKDSLVATGISSDYLSDLMEECRAQKVIILDCCFSGAVAKNIKHDHRAVILASSDVLEYSRSSETLSLYTKHIVAGIQGGAAAQNKIITASSLHEYVKPLIIAEQPDMNPQIWSHSDGYNFPIAFLKEQTILEISKPQSLVSKSTRSPDVTAYLEGILNDAKTETLKQYYIDLSATTIQTKSSLINNKFNLIIPASFKVIDKQSNLQNEPKILDSIGEAFSLHKQFVLLGAPGSGKSTSLRKLLSDYAEKAMQDSEAPIPILINLAEWQKETVYVIELINQLGCKANGLYPIPPNRLLLLLDGLNEISAQDYLERVKLLESWLKSNPNVSIVISCREKHYKNSKQLTIPTVQIEPLDNRRIELFLNAALGIEATQEILPQLGSFEPELRSARDLIHLANNPYFLAMICYIYQSQPHLPNSRGKLFQKFVEALYTREEEIKNTKDLTQQDLIKGLSAIAFSMQKQRSATSVHTIWAERQIPRYLSIENLWDLGRETGLLKLVKEERIFQFTHQLILEYFAAEGLLQRLDNLSNYIRKPEFSRKQRKSSSWDEVIFTLAGITEPNLFLTKLAKIDPFLAVECFDHVPKEEALTEETLTSVINNIISFFNSYTPEIREAAINKLVQIGNRVIPYLADVLNNNNNQVVKRACLRTLAEFNHPDVLTKIAWALLDKDRWVRKEASDLISNYFQTEAMDKFVDHLVTLRKENNKKVEELLVCLHKIGVILPQELSAVEIYDGDLLIKNLKDKNPNVRVTAIKILKKLNYDGLAEKVQPLLNDENCNVRAAVIKTLKELNYEGLIEKILPLLNDENCNIRAAVIKTLKELNYEGLIEKILPLLNDKYPNVRMLAFNILEKSYEGSAEKILPLLDDKSNQVRVIAINTLKKLNYEGLVEKILPFLNDENSAVKETVIKMLKELNYEGLAEKILPFLNDESSFVRETVINTLKELSYEGLIEKIMPFLSDESGFVRVAVIRTLKELNYEGLIEKIIPLLNDEHYFVRKTVVDTLRKLHYEGLEIILLPLLEDKSLMVRKAVENALQSLKISKTTVENV
jgi:HEAT repeat protein